jgi:outer membrane protein TolC
LAVRLQEQVLEQVEALVKQGQLQRTELMLARADLVDARAGLGLARNQLTVAWNDLRRLLVMVDEECSLKGTLESSVPKLQAADLILEGGIAAPCPFSDLD